MAAPDAVIAPGLVAANSMIGPGQPSERTVDPSLRAIDNFDPESQAWAQDLAAGVTTLYLPPARARLIAGQAAVVKLAGAGERVLELVKRLRGVAIRPCRACWRLSSHGCRAAAHLLHADWSWWRVMSRSASAMPCPAQ